MQGRNERSRFERVAMIFHVDWHKHLLFVS